MASILAYTGRKDRVASLLGAVPKKEKYRVDPGVYKI